MRPLLRDAAALAVALATSRIVSAGPPAHAAASPSALRNARTAPRALESERMGLFRRMLDDVSPAYGRRGAVTASPSRQPNYRFDWTRDGALTMRQVVAELRANRDPVQRLQNVARLKAYTLFSWRKVIRSGPAGLGEPKSELSGRPFRGPWGRPQNDGPALRALTHLEFADWLLGHGEESYVKDILYTRERRTGSPITRDLDYVAPRWWEASFDLWEEKKSYHLYTRAVQHKALVLGAKLASRLGDSAGVARYTEAAHQLHKALQDHWDPQRGVLKATLPGNDHGRPTEGRTLDSAVILAAIQTYGEGAPFEITDPRILSTAHALEEAFRREYPVNRGRRGAVAIGRYPGDAYTGYDSRPGGGNPWVLTTAAFAELHYRVAREIAGGLAVTGSNRGFLQSALGDAGQLREGMRLRPGDALLAELRSRLTDKGDDYLNIIRQTEAVERAARGPRWVEALSEQINKKTGRFQGAENLGWSDSSVVSALRARSEIDTPPTRS